MNALKTKAQKLNELNIRVFYHESFDDEKRKHQILSELPGYEKFQNDFIKVNKLRQKEVSPEMRPCYEAPLLSFEQEQHLFRKMNYFKYKAKKHISELNSSRLSEKKIRTIEEYLNLATILRNQIAESNFRLATQLLKSQVTFYREHTLLESLLSDAYMDVLKAVDYFDWTKGYKFSTYTTWVLKKNFFRDSKQKSCYAEKFTYLDEKQAEILNSRGDGHEEEQAYHNQQCLVSKLIDLLAKDKSITDGQRQARILEKYFGVNGFDKYTLEQISEEFNVTKERIRQIKEKGLALLKSKVKEMKMDYELEV